MRTAAELIAIAATHGLDLQRFAVSEPQGAAAASRRKAAGESGVEAIPARDGRSPRAPQRPPAATFEDLPWLAARWSFAGDESSYWPLFWGLAQQAQRIARRAGWPPQVPGLLARDGAGQPLRGARPALPELGQLLAQLQQPTYSLNNAGKVVVDKAPAGMPSPDRADAVMICFAPGNVALESWLKLAAP